MLDKLTSVSPPLKTDALIKHQNSEKLEDLGAKNLKSDFKEHLKEQFKKEQTKINTVNKRNFNAEKKESQPGENKKKVTLKKDSEELDESEVREKEKLDKSFDPTTILINMVSDESEIKIPDFEENLAQVEESTRGLSQNLYAQVSADEQADDFSLQSVMNEKAWLEKSMPVSTESTEADIPIQSKPESIAAPGVESEIALVSPAPTSFQEKVMEALRKNKSEALDFKTETQSDSLNQTLTKKVAAKDQADSFESQGGNQGSDETLGDSQFLKPDEIKNELLKSESNHFGQTDFHTKLSTHNQVGANSVELALNGLSVADEPSVQELLSQANFLATRGGGEVTLKMSGTDGMADVHLKVMLDNGKLNIELNTQDKSVKKLIEDSLSDLRSSLVARQINLEHVKINNVNAVNTENNSQSLQNNSHQSGAESGQSRAFEQLQQQMQREKNQNEQRQFVKNAIFEERPVVIPLMSVQKSAAHQYYGQNKAQSLNAVA